MIDERITLRKLEIFSVFIGTGNISKAAEILQMSAVSVHRALHSLEEGIECPLFVHKGRNLVPLQTAQALYLQCRSLLPQLETVFEEVRRIGGVGNDRMRLGTLYSLTVRTVPRLVMGTKFRRPNLEFDLTMGSNEDLMKKLLENQLDAVILALYKKEIDASRFEVLPLFEDELFLAVPSTWQGGTASICIDLKNLQKEKFITLSEGFATYRDFNAAFEVAGFQPSVISKVKDIFSMLSLVQAGMGIALLPGRMCGLYESSVRYLRIEARYQQHQLIGIVFDRCREHEANFRSLVAEGRMYARQVMSQLTHEAARRCF